ncbi:asparagine synthase-related protein [Asticcacaulis sp. AC466]|uniref:asparagine synthase-related protein n=1 Tax=Asticcacaulis sp. AC466 TaxID=1282362 RepID=UPI0012DD068E|nr:asparagine synthase-related protein [Asticcacaulis sp. AC466]
MSAIAAVVLNEPGRPGDVVQGMLDAMPYRAPDGCVVWTGNGVALGVGFMRVLAEEPTDPTIFTFGKLVITCDIRFDNREELISALSLDKGVREAEVLAGAFSKWGLDCVQHFIGDFAFIILDLDNGTLFAARDHMGVRPLFYRHDDAGFCIATEHRVLVAPGAPFRSLAQDEVLHQQVADFVVGRDYQEHTIIFEGISRLPAGSRLLRTPGQAPVVETYWLPTANPRSESDAPAPAELRAVLEMAIACRMRAARPVGSMLSGGLDSSSISCLASRLSVADGTGPIDTFSIVFDDNPNLNERPFIEAAVAVGTFKPHFLSFSGYAPLENLEELMRVQGRLVNSPGTVLVYKAYQAISAEGLRVFLDGHGGDEVVSHGLARVNELASVGRWRDVWRELAGAGRLNGESRIAQFILLFVRHGKYKGAYRVRRAFIKAINWLTPPPDDLLQAKYRNLTTSAPKRLAETEAARQEKNLRSAHITHVLEHLEIIAARAGTQPRFPFFDKRMVEFCMSLPSSSKMKDGWTRLILRQAMEGILPSKIQWRTGKFDFAPHVGIGIFKHHVPMLEDIISRNADEVGEYINLDIVRPILKEGKRNVRSLDGKSIQILWRTAALSLWLRQKKKAMK